MMRCAGRNVRTHLRACGAVIVGLMIAQPSSAQNNSADSRSIVATQTTPSAMADFVSRARAGTDQFRDRRVAIAAGYRRLGMDFPSMGEHWVNPGMVLAGDFDAARPAILSYIVIDGQPTLAGVVYAIPLVNGAKPPPVPGNAGMWHEHNGTVDDESLLSQHGGEHQSHGQHSDSTTTDGTRLAVLHAWVGVPNPAGLFTTENWALPFARLGLPAPAPIPVGAARALSLATGAEDYYTALGTSAGAGSATVTKTLDEATRAAELIAAHARAAHALSTMDISALNAVWGLALHNIARDCGPAIATRLNGGVGPEPQASF